MALPTSRNTTYAAGAQIKSADLNDLQDQIVALYGGARPERARRLPPIGHAVNMAFYPNDGYAAATGAPAELSVMLAANEGERLLSMNARVYVVASGSITAKLFRATSAGAVALASQMTSATGSTWVLLSETLATPHVVGAEHIYLHVSFTTTGQRVGTIGVGYDVP